jgi:hypothetical protein
MALQIYIFRISELASTLDAIGEYYDINARNIKSSLEPGQVYRMADSVSVFPRLRSTIAGYRLSPRVCYETT